MEECELNLKTNSKDISKQNSFENTVHSGKTFSEVNCRESPPSKSKVSTRISQSMIGSKGGRDLSEISDIDVCNEISELNGKCHVKINLCLKVKDKSKIFSFNLNVRSNFTINELIEYSVKKFNDIFEKNSMPFLLEKDFSLFSMKPSKKSGEPKSDMPSFDGEADLCDCNTNQFSLVFKINSSCIDFKNGEKERSQNFRCQNCLVF